MASARRQSDERRALILDAARRLFEEQGVARTSRRDVAREADVATRSVGALAAGRSELLAEVTASLPFPPTSQRLQDAASSGDDPASAILAAARDAFGAPASVWDVIELQALALAPFDARLAEVARERIALRWDAARTVVAHLRGEGAVDAAIDDDAAALHLLAVGAGLALVSPVVPRQADSQAWLSLAARLLESLAATDPPESSFEGVLVPWRIRVEVPDSPAATARVLRVLALIKAEVVTLFTHAQSDGTQLVDTIASVPGALGRQQIAQALSSVSQRIVVARGLPEDEQDLVARILDAAASLVEHPERAPRAAADLVLADSWTVEPATEGEDATSDVMRLQWTPDHHVVLRRKDSPFVAVERARASALLRLVDAMARAPEGSGGFGWVEHLEDGTRVAIRLARPEDAEAVAEMHSRCSVETRYQRYFAPVSEWREDQLRRIAGGHRGATLVAQDDAGHIVGLGNVFPDRPGDTETAEIAVIVEDAWQGRGLGGRLLTKLVDLARRQGFHDVVALVLAGNSGMIRLLERMPVGWQREEDPDLGATVVRLRAALD